MGARKLNILIAGVGGQGLITLATLLARAAVASGSNALVAETHGLSQRGGSVTVHLRLGDVVAPLIPRGGADVLLGLELIEAARTLDYLRVGGSILVSDVVLRPAIPGVRVPSRSELVEYLEKAGGRLYTIPASKLASEVGGLLYVNTVMLGALAATGVLKGFIDLDVLESLVGGMKRGEENLKAYRLGFNYCLRECVSSV